ncbi:carbohydrate kinase [Oerskovia turbata]|uniref:Carbohydrate kinase n=1 Tax=Oerskovia turbata TaxID=1713 RepID=A0A4Q1KLT9_9CELL|nr:FGGY-family carbohydrate kinase [Oerskovia turbata]RXR22781.1 carbohydrate kinase [Oerskovia turbata]RXR30727.1 carbohydrate kinase [Oerskovia turbata]TGJ95994.1 carbohydrate kinase [Actinotalea fermentans ATCC 43279 = JCM 9966 = DSM 3133]
MTRTPAVLGIDAGTTSVKSVVLSLDGEVLGSSRSTVRIRRPRPDRAEQDMDEVWSAVAATICAACDEAGDVELIGAAVTGQGDGAWLVDEDGRPVGPALLWLDGRAAPRVAAWGRDGRGALVREITGSALFPGALPVLLEELEENDPGLVRSAATHLNCKDWIRFRLTGRRATDPSEASRTYLDVAQGTYSPRLLAGLGHERFERLLPPLLPPGTVAGHVTAAAARETGLPVGLPVATGMVDTPAGGVGLGVIDPGQVYAILGTTAFVGAVQDGPRAPADLPVITVALGESDHVVECLAPMNGTPNLDWARQVTGLDSLDWEDVARIVRAEPAGAGGVLYLPYAGVSGERAPFVDTDASAAWLNLSVRTTPGQLLRAVYEGIALSLRECMDLLGVDHDATVRLCGGGAQSSLVCEIVADVTGRPVERSTVAELGVRGVAALVLVATGRAPDLRAATGRLGTDTHRFEPDPRLRTLHDAQATVFTAVREANRHHWASLRDLRQASHQIDQEATRRERPAHTVVARPPSGTSRTTANHDKELP